MLISLIPFVSGAILRLCHLPGSYPLPLRRCFCVTLIAMLFSSAATLAQGTKKSRLPKIGVLKQQPGTYSGYTLISPLSSHNTFLLDMDGQPVHSWQTQCKPGQCCYLRNDGSLLRAGKVDNFYQFPRTSGSGGRIQIFDWEGKLTWDYLVASPYRMSHHDLEPLPNGNVLCICWEVWLPEDVIAAGRNPESVNRSQMWSETIYELKPKGLNDAEVVWSWSVRDHLIQSYDPEKENYGDVAAHPELVDINVSRRPAADWLHMNAIDYNAERDEIMLCSRTFGEFWVIDHSTSTEEARQHSGGKRGKGGDILYRWGNPRNFKRGDSGDQTLFAPHDAHWIPEGLPGAGNVLIFNNGIAPERNWSEVIELKLPLDDSGNYRAPGDKGYGPKTAEWTYEDRGRFYSARISGSQRLPNGNTLICSGTQHALLEVNPDGELLWVFQNAPRYFTPPRARQDGFKVADLSAEDKALLQESLGISLKDGGTMFRATRFAADHEAIKGRTLKPGSRE